VDILHQDRKSFSLITLDAKGCYDRIAQPIAAIAMKRQGATKEMISLMFDTIERKELHTGTPKSHTKRGNINFTEYYKAMAPGLQFGQ
jgi:hypothetical protein